MRPNIPGGGMHFGGKATPLLPTYGLFALTVSLPTLPCPSSHACSMAPFRCFESKRCSCVLCVARAAACGVRGYVRHDVEVPSGKCQRRKRRRRRPRRDPGTACGSPWVLEVMSSCSHGAQQTIRIRDGLCWMEGPLGDRLLGFR